MRGSINCSGRSCSLDNQMKLKSLTYEKVMSIPGLFKKYGDRATVAKKLGCAESTLDKWVKRLRKNGYKVEIKRGRKPVIT